MDERLTIQTCGCLRVPVVFGEFRCRHCKVKIQPESVSDPNKHAVNCKQFLRQKQISLRKQLFKESYETHHR